MYLISEDWRWDIFIDWWKLWKNGVFIAIFMASRHSNCDNSSEVVYRNIYESCLKVSSAIDLVTTLLQVSETIVGLNFVNNNKCFNLALLDLKNSENRFC